MTEKQKFMRFEYTPGACDKKTFELALFAGALGAGCHHWVQNHFAGAKKAGATEVELREIIAGVMMVGAARIRHFAVDNLEGLTLEEKEG